MHPSTQRNLIMQGRRQELQARRDRRNVPSLFGGGGTLRLQWVRIDGGQSLNASPLIKGIKPATIPATVPADLDPGAVNPATGEETTAPTGTFPDGVGYGTLITASGYQRVLVRITGARAVLAGWKYYVVSTINIDDDATPTPGRKTFWVVDNE